MSRRYNRRGDSLTPRDNDRNALPARYEMIRYIERFMDELIDRKIALEQQVVQLQELCGKKDWAPDYVHHMECKAGKLKLVEEQIERCEVELSELYSGATKGWPLRGEVS